MLMDKVTNILNPHFHHTQTIISSPCSLSSLVLKFCYLIQNVRFPASTVNFNDTAMESSLAQVIEYEHGLAVNVNWADFNA